MHLSRFLQPVDPSTNPPSPQDLGLSQANTVSVPESLMLPISPQPTRSPPPSPALRSPDFEIDPSQVSALRRPVDDRTLDLAIVELEQLHAMCLDCVAAPI